jgi:hypothetical protein
VRFPEGKAEKKVTLTDVLVLVLAGACKVDFRPISELSPSTSFPAVGARRRLVRFKLLVGAGDGIVDGAGTHVCRLKGAELGSYLLERVQ